MQGNQVEIDWLKTFNILRNIYINQSYSNLSLNSELRDMSSADASFVRNFVKGTIRYSIKLDYYIDKLASKGIQSLKTNIKIVLRMGLFAIEYLDNMPDYAAVNESVNLASRVAGGSEKIINAILRNFLRNLDELSLGIKDIPTREACPENLFSLIKNQYPDSYEKIITSLNQAIPVIARCNLLRGTRDALVSALSGINIQTKILEDTQSGLVLSGENIINNEYYRKGFYSIQNLPSILAIEALNPAAHSKCLDLCAAPGGKSFAAQELMLGTGQIIACDIHQHRLDLIEKDAERLGLDNIQTRLLDATEFVPEFQDSFDYVICDVPCSGIGTIRSKPEIKLFFDESKFSGIYETQYRILENGFKYLKNGGYLIYSTCTLLKQENEYLTQKFINNNKICKLIENKTFMPYNEMIGFYYCILSK